MAKRNILHLSDLHSGAEPAAASNGKVITAAALQRRKQMLRKLLETLGEIKIDDPCRASDIVVVSGDIARKSSQTDYEKAKVRLNKLLSDGSFLFSCTAVSFLRGITHE